MHVKLPGEENCRANIMSKRIHSKRKRKRDFTQEKKKKQPLYFFRGTS